MTLRIGTAEGLFESGARPVVSGPVRVFGDALIAGDHRLLWRRDDTWSEIGTAPGLRCAVDAPGGVIVGTEGAHLLQLGREGFQRLVGFDRIDGRADWYTPWGGPPEVRSLARTHDGVLLANVHVGGIARSLDHGRSWSPTVDIHFDVHEVRAAPGPRALVVAASGAGLLVSDDAGDSWRAFADGLDDWIYCRAVAVCESGIVVSAATGPRARESALYRTSRQADEPFTVVSGPVSGRVDTGAIDARNDEAVFGTTHGEVWTSVDGGTTWHRSRQGLPPVTSVRYAG
jgi:hypothetical protein